MEAGIWDLVKGLMSWVVYPFMLVCAHFYKKHTNEIDHLKQEITSLKISNAVTMSQVENIREDIKELSTLIRESQASIRDDLKSLKQELHIHGSRN